jgi:hypothetical protein
MTKRWQGCCLLMSALLGSLSLPAGAQSQVRVPFPFVARPVSPAPACPPTGNFLFGFGVNSDAGLAGGVVVNERDFVAQELEPIDWQSVALWLTQSIWQQAQGMPAPNGCVPVVLFFTPDGKPVPVPPPDCCCPRTKQPMACPGECCKDAEAWLKSTVVENLQKLEKACQLCRKAELCCEAGQFDKACQLYEEVLRLCPGSRFAPAATKGLQDVQARRSAEAAAACAEEQEMIPPPKPAKKKCCEPTGVWLVPPPPPGAGPVGDDILVLVEPNPPRLFLRIEQPAGSEEHEQSSCEALCTMMRRVMAVLGAVGCADDCESCTPAPHVECELQFGNCVIRMTVDKKCPNCCCPKQECCPKENARR